MRSLVILLALCSGPSRAADIAVVLNFDGRHSDRTVMAMQREVSQIFRDTGVRFNFAERNQLPSTVSDLIVLDFKGQCVASAAPGMLDERGPFAETAVTDGVVLPFGTVHCDRVRRSIRNASDTTYGKALGRVVAHEIYHILAKTKAHSPSGVNKAGLSPSQLTSKRLAMTPDDLERFYNP